jgi:glycogen synthase
VLARVGLHILLPADVFPPGSVGGAAWSAHSLARALLARGHAVTALVPRQGQRGTRVYAADGVPALAVGYQALALPFVQNYCRHERFWPRFAVAIASQVTDRPTLIHAQHVQAVPAAVLAGARTATPVVATVRDHWPWDYFATGLHANRLPYPASSFAALAGDLPVRLGPWRGALALPALPYLLAHLRRRADYLARCDAVIAVSHYIAGRLARQLPAHKIHVLPNMIDMAGNDRIAATTSGYTDDEPFLLFIGKLEPNKGAHYLGAIFRHLATDTLLMPDGRRRPYALLIAGNGHLRTQVQAELAACKVQVRFLEWVDHDEVLRLMARCAVLLFPSGWGEPLSRVLLEGSALGAPIVAMPTGGTGDIIRDGETGLLAATPTLFARRLAVLLTDPALRSRLGQAARQAAWARFSVEAVLPQVEELYRELLNASKNQRTRN